VPQSQNVCVDNSKVYLSLNAVVTQPKNCPFGVNTSIELGK